LIGASNSPTSKKSFAPAQAKMAIPCAEGLSIAVIALLVLIVRIVGEEKMLMNELQGYSEYMKRVRYRLLPTIW